MKQEMIDIFEKAIANERESDLPKLVQAGVLSADLEPVPSLVNLLPAEYTSVLVDMLMEHGLDMENLISGLGRLLSGDQDMGAFCALLYLFEAVDFPRPRLYMRLPSSPAMLRRYLKELLADIQDCYEDA